MTGPAKGLSALRRGRFSESGACYFLTICTDHRGHGLEKPALTNQLLELAQSPTHGWRLRTIVIMPDHVHLLVELSGTLALADSIRLYKGRSAGLLRSQGLKWQRGCYDHRLRPHEDVLPVFLYIFLNPYREDLLIHLAKWNGYWCEPEDWAWFEPMTNSSCPFPEWLT